MHLRNLLLFFSLAMIGFCLTLFFQTENPVQSMNYEQYKNLNYSESKSISLSELNEKIAPLRLEDLISEIYEKNKLKGEKTRVMEVGFGNGRVLMELKKRFPDIEFYGINKQKTRTFYRRESFILTALKFDIMTKQEAEEMFLPYVVFQDLDFGQAFPYDEGKFDVIYSHGVVMQMRYAFEFFNEILRVLKKDGLSVHTDVKGVNIFSKGLLLTLKEATSEFRRKGIEIYVLDNPESVRFKKTAFPQAFPVIPHQPVPAKLDKLSPELRRPEMSYNIIHQ